jgi:hypothetical protein
VDKYAHGLIPCRQMIRRSRDHSRGLGLSPGSSCKSHCQLYHKLFRAALFDWSETGALDQLKRC